jgi:hypothetical protein
MRDAIGGTLVFQIIMAFIVIFIGIMAVGMNFATTFRAKNQIVHILEQYETYDKAKDHIDAYLAKIKYYDGGSNPIKTDYVDCLNKTSNYCIKEALAENGGYYYVVKTYVVFDFPIIGRFIQSPVTGETSVLKDLTKIK